MIQAVEKLGFTEPTPIQSGVIEYLNEGFDVIGQAQTGTGKTAAFALPILNKIDFSTGDVQALVLTPTRELANQVTRSIKEFASYNEMNILAVYGGQSYPTQKKALKNGVDIVVGTPGRLLDLIKRNDLDLSKTHTIALDEADEMLSMGFVDDIETILKSLPSKRQTLLFSATMPGPIRRLADKYMTNPKSVTIERQELTAETIEQRYYLVNGRDRTAATIRILEMEDTARVIIFGQTRHGTADLAARLTNYGFSAETLNGDLSQPAREQVMRRFRGDSTKILVATDVAARGLDVDGVSHIINYEIPREIESYVHRIGRTGRAGETGVAVSLVTSGDQGKLRQIEKLINAKITLSELPTTKQIQKNRDQRLTKKLEQELKAGKFDDESKTVLNLIEEGYNALDIASVALKLAKAVEYERTIPEVSTFEEGKKGSRSSNRSKRGSSRSRSGSGRRSGGSKSSSSSGSRGYKGKNGEGKFKRTSRTKNSTSRSTSKNTGYKGKPKTSNNKRRSAKTG